jgi:XTP/dITP diphosphohydrolase
MKKVIFATKNKGKIKEIQAVLGDSYEVVTMEEAGITVDVDETGTTFEENAVIKAEAIAKICGEVVLADDSGLEIDYLNGEPGIYSARYMGHDTSYDIKNKSLIDRLEGVPEDKRTARFVCAVAAAIPGKETVVVRGTMEGIIGYEIKGENGFGYDPIFFLPQYGKTSAEISPEEKNEISHRGKALRMIKEKLEVIL